MERGIIATDFLQRGLHTKMWNIFHVYKGESEASHRKKHGLLFKRACLKHNNASLHTSQMMDVLKNYL
jgi:hypothetical protein